jgi:hypothetical protein
MSLQRINAKGLERVALERIYQAGLFRRDYRMVSPHILKHLAMHGANDLRTIFLVDD